MTRLILLCTCITGLSAVVAATAAHEAGSASGTLATANSSAQGAALQARFDSRDRTQCESPRVAFSSEKAPGLMVIVR